MAKSKRERSNGRGKLRDTSTAPAPAPSAATASANGHAWSATPVRSRVAAAKLADTLEHLGASETVVVAAKKG